MRNRDLDGNTEKKTTQTLAFRPNEPVERCEGDRDGSERQLGRIHPILVSGQQVYPGDTDALPQMVDIIDPCCIFIQARGYEVPETES